VLPVNVPAVSGTGQKIVVAALVGHHVANDASLCGEDEVVIAMVQLKVACIVRDHAVQPADTVFTLTLMNASQPRSWIAASLCKAATSLAEFLKLAIVCTPQ